jgi:putative flippase GtrA
MKQDTLARLRSLLRHRFIKFGTVGAIGVPVNLGVLYLGQEYLFTFIASTGLRLNVSLALAIFCATINNFAWNRRWTWADRRAQHDDRSLVMHFGQYALACWVGILLQFIITKLLVWFGWHYLVGNLSAIVMASLFNFLVNDRWTFSRHRAGKPGP